MPTTHSHVRHAGALSNLLALTLLTLPLPTHASFTVSGTDLQKPSANVLNTPG